jgi:hypothetical protein
MLATKKQAKALDLAAVRTPLPQGHYGTYEEIYKKHLVADKGKSLQKFAERMATQETHVL